MMTILKKLRSAVDFILDNLITVLFIGIVIVYSSREVSDLDIWLHLKSGQYILQHHLVPLTDIFSYTAYGKPWINHEWLFQVITRLFHFAGGAAGLILMQNTVVVTTFAIFFLASLKKGNNVTVFLVLYLTMLACVYRFMIRPDIFSFFFIVVYLCSLRRFMENGFRLIWVLPLLQIAWVNIHGLALAGPLIVFIAILGELAKRHVKLPWEWNNIRRIDNSRLKQLFILLGLLVGASFINPYGAKGLTYPFFVIGQVSGAGKILFNFVMELSRPIRWDNLFELGRLVFYKELIVISLCSFIYNRRRVNLFDLILWAVFLFFSLAAHRNISYFALAAGFVTLNNIVLAHEHGVEAALPAGMRGGRLRVMGRYLCIAFILYYPVKEAFAFTELIADTAGTYTFRASRNGVTQARYPHKASEFLIKHDFPEYMFNDFNSGSYLIGMAWPDRKVFIDGRTELYGPDFFMDYVRAGAGDPETIDRLVKKYDIKGFFLTISANDLQEGLLHYLLYNPGWKLVYLDESAVIFLKDAPENAELIGKFQIDLKNWNPPPVESLKSAGAITSFPYPYLYRARFLYRHGFPEAAAKEAAVFLSMVPGYPEALAILNQSLGIKD
ncbi:MAG: hypothetical protein JXB40_05885 [Candidatus Omnitrophica bacterium]|nr:hypothetical protein [Candidatus Omnitrophota bacterium]